MDSASQCCVRVSVRERKKVMLGVESKWDIIE